MHSAPIAAPCAFDTHPTIDLPPTLRVQRVDEQTCKGFTAPKRLFRPAPPATPSARRERGEAAATRLGERGETAGQGGGRLAGRHETPNRSSGAGKGRNVAGRGQLCHLQPLPVVVDCRHAPAVNKHAPQPKTGRTAIERSIGRGVQPGPRPMMLT